MKNNEIVDCRPSHLTPLQALILSNYRLIAESDLKEPIQPDEELEQKALADLKRLGDLRKTLTLEVGPGRGHLTRLLVNSGAVVDVCDVAEEYLECLKEIEVQSRYLAFAEEPSWATKADLHEKYDLIILCDVLEHLTHPADALLNLRLLLNKGGRIYIRVPANEALVAYSRVIGCPHELVHLRTYTRSILKREILACGLRAMHIGYTSESLTPRSFAWGQRRFWAHQRRMLGGDHRQNEDSHPRPADPYGRSLLVRMLSHFAAKSWASLLLSPIKPLIFVQQELWAIASSSDK